MPTTTEKRVVHIVIDSKRAASELRNIDKNMDRTRRSAMNLERSFGRLNRVLGVLTLGTVSGLLIRQMIELNDQYTALLGRVNLVARDTVGLTTAMEDLYDVAQRTRSSLEGTASLYARLGLAARSAGIEHQELLDISQTVADTLRLSGASAKESAAFMTQFSQAMASGRFAGDEYRSMAESNVVMMLLLADALGTTVAGLREMSEEGELAADNVLPAILEATDKVRRQAEALPKTVSQSMTQLTNAWTVFLAKVDSGVGVFGGFTWVLDKVTAGFENLGIILEDIGGTAGKSSFQVAMEEQVALRKETSIKVDRLNRKLERAQDLRNVSPAQQIAFTLGLQDPEQYRLSTVTQVAKERALELQRLAEIEDKIQALNEGEDLRLRAAQEAERLAKERAARLARETAIEEREKRIQAMSRAIGERATHPLSFADRAAEAAAAVRQEVNKINEASQLLIPTLAEIDRLFFEEEAISDELYETLKNKLIPVTENVTETTKKQVEWTDALSTALGNTLANATATAADAMVDFAVRGEQSFSDMAQSILESIAQMLIQFALLRSLSLVGLPVGGTVATASAQGNAFQGGNVIPFAKGGVVNQPTLFPMANGAGLMGEAGPEAVMPLTRDRRGRLGVSGSGTVVNINNYSGEPTEVERANGANGEELIEVIVGRVAGEIVAGEIASGGAPARAIEQAYGVRRAGYVR